MRIALINAPLESIVSDRGVGHQMPLGLLMIAGPLLDAGHQTSLIDAAAEHLSDREVIHRLAEFDPQIVLISHVGSTQAHPCCIRLLGEIKRSMPQVVTVYGGVHPTYHFREILAEQTGVDIIVRGEGEATTSELVAVLAKNDSPSNSNRQDALNLADLSRVPGIAWRRSGGVVCNQGRTPIRDLDASRIAWELIDDWDRYQAFGLGRAAVVQFSRGCPHTCTYCGQWMFWKRWRHRDVTRFVDELELLRRQHDVRFVWLADENPTTEKETWKALLEEISRRELGIRICASIRAADIVRDADMLDLYRRAGFLYVLMGIETVTEETLHRIRKNSCLDDGYQAIRLLREHGILSIVDYIFGLDEETPGTIWQGFRGLNRFDGDFVNALYVTPHSWTPLGRAMRGAAKVEEDLSRWDYRHQVVAVEGLSPAQLFLGVKLVELFYHVHPRRLLRLVAGRDRDLRRQLRHAYAHVAKVYLAELVEELSPKRRRRDSNVLPPNVETSVKPNAAIRRPSRPTETCQ